MTMGLAWPWLTLAGIGAYHGLNPAMGWLFAVALGLAEAEGHVVPAPLPYPHDVFAVPFPSFAD